MAGARTEGWIIGSLGLHALRPGPRRLLRGVSADGGGSGSHDLARGGMRWVQARFTILWSTQPHMRPLTCSPSTPRASIGVRHPSPSRTREAPQKGELATRLRDPAKGCRGRALRVPGPRRLERAANAHELDDAPRREVWRQLNTVAVIAELPEHRRELSKAIHVRRGVGGQLLHRKPPSGATSSAPATRIRSSATLSG